VPDNHTLGACIRNTLERVRALGYVAITDTKARGIVDDERYTDIRANRARGPNINSCERKCFLTERNRSFPNCSFSGRLRNGFCRRFCTSRIAIFIWSFYRWALYIAI
jgi:hypothetical protein